MATRYRNGWWLAQKYHEEDWAQAEIAEECDVSARTIRKYMNEYGIETGDVEGENHGLYGKERDEAVKEKISDTLAGRQFDDETIEKRADKMRGRTLPADVREKMSESTAGEQNPNWRGGYSRRYGAGWATARTRVRERDEVCQHCGADGTERRLQVHHIIPVRRFRVSADATLSDAHDPGNLILLCERCHPKADHGSLEFDSELDDPTL